MGDKRKMTRKEILEKTIDFDDAVNRIIRLEEEVKEWKDKADLWCKTANLKDHNIMINKELEKENAELKHTIATLRQEKDNVSMHAKAMEVVAKTKSDQLTKAKEIIKLLLWDLRNKESDPLIDVNRAEQFLNSEVEE